MVGRRYSLVHRPGSYLINDTKDPNAPAELFQVGDRSQALLRYRQLEAHSTSARLHLAKGQAGTWVRRAGTSVRGTLPHRYGRAVPARRWNVGARSWVAARMGPERRGHALVPLAGVLSDGVQVAIMLIAVDTFDPESRLRSTPWRSLRSRRRPSGWPAILHAPTARLRPRRFRLPPALRRRRTSPRGGPSRCNRGTELGFANGSSGPDLTPPPCRAPGAAARVVVPADLAREVPARAARAARAARVRGTRAVAARRTTPVSVRAGQGPGAVRAAGGRRRSGGGGGGGGGG